MKLDPILSLAMNMHSSKGVYALLLGSGISRSAKIPSGWDVVLDLVGKVAKLEGLETDCAPNPAAWFKATYGENPDYSKLLDQLTTTSEQRQQMLRGYFEPTDDEREQGLKRPTAAHRAIAQLVVGGYIRVIITTNFDHLMEDAIRAAGVTPAVLSTPDALAGALPLAHQRCVVIKLHGDYLDTRLMNTPAELGLYDERVNIWLDRILDEFGLIVCGWSGEYDTALRAAIERCSTRRFGFFWTAFGDPAPAATKLIEARAGTVIRIKGADDFFDELAAKISALEDVFPDHPLNAASMVAMVKRYVAVPGQHIRLHDLLLRETDRAFADAVRVDAEQLRTHSTTYTNVVESYLAATATLRQALATAAYWGGNETIAILTKCLERLGRNTTPRGGGIVINDAFRLYPALVCLYAAGIGFVAKNEYVQLATMLTAAKVKGFNEQKQLLQQLRSARSDVNTVTKSIPAHAEQMEPFSELMFSRLAPELGDFFSDDITYNRGFNEFELLTSMLTEHQSKPADDVTPDQMWVGSGRFTYAYNRSNRGSPLFPGQDQGDDPVAWVKQQEPFAQLIDAGFFGGSWNKIVNLRLAAQRLAAKRMF